jgi:glycosyltransferase involved in cell wall biosynthesis
VSLKDHLPRFAGQRLLPSQLLWMPPYYPHQPVSPESVPEAEKTWDLLFVGTMNPSINPERCEFMERARDLMPNLHCCGGDYAQLFPQARLVLNHSIAGDLNFRVFEALGCGACLLTPRVGHGLEDLFIDGEDLFLFEQEDLPGLARLAGRLLADPAARLNAAKNGQAKVAGRHLACHRAAQFLRLLRDWQDSGQSRELIRNRLRDAARIHGAYLKLIYLLLAGSFAGYPAEIRAAYLAAARKSD